MRILQLTPQFPWPTHQGTTLRNFHLLKELAQRHEVHLFSLLGEKDDPTRGPVSGIAASITTGPQPQRTMGDRIKDLFFHIQPDMARRLWHAEAFQALAEKALQLQPDILLMEGIEMAPYFFALHQAGIPYGKAIYDAHNAETILQKRTALADLRRPKRWPAALYSSVQTAKLWRYERLLVQYVDAVSAVSEPDAIFLRSLDRTKPLEVVTNGVDMAFYNPDAPHPAVLEEVGPHLVFTGKMDFRPNVDAVLWFAEEVMPRLQAMGVDAHFWVVGRSPHARLAPLNRRAKITITGEVPDVRPYILQADVYVVPLLAGGGTRFKILEALALSKPVVSTRLGADGIPVNDGKHLVLADEPEAFARCIVQLLENREEAAAMGRRGRAFVAAHFDWKAIVPKLENLFR